MAEILLEKGFQQHFYRIPSLDFDGEMVRDNDEWSHINFQDHFWVVKARNAPIKIIKRISFGLGLGRSFDSIYLDDWCHGELELDSFWTKPVKREVGVKGRANSRSLEK